MVVLGGCRSSCDARRLPDDPSAALDRQFLQNLVDAPPAAPESAAEADATPKVALGRLRLNFGLPLPELVDGHWHHVRLRLSNELGLFSAEAFGAEAACAVAYMSQYFYPLDSDKKESMVNMPYVLVVVFISVIVIKIFCIFCI